MSSTDPHTPSDQTTDLDDDEGHGLREVAAGLGAAAVLAGGGAGLAAAASTGPAVHPSLVHPGATVTTTVGSVTVDPVGTTDRLTDQAVGEARATLQATGAGAGALTISCTGDSSFAPSLRTLTL